MNVVSELIESGRFTHFVALTFNAGLGYFETTVLRALRLRGLRRAAVVADYKALSASLEAELAHLTGAGRSYVVVGAHASVSFHPKLLLVSGPEEARLYVGSGNLSHGGLEGNHEVFDCWSVRMADPRVPEAFATAQRYLYDFINEHVPAPDSEFKETMTGAFAVDVLARKPLAARDETSLLRSPGPLLSRLPVPAQHCDRLVMMAPSFDADGLAAVALAQHLKATGFEVWTDLRTTNMSPPAAAAIANAGGVVRIVEPPRPLHAKMLFASGPGFALGLHGSANLSVAAWQGHNAELIVIRRGAAASTIDELLRSLPEPRLLSESDEERLQAAAQRPGDSVPVPSGPIVVRAEWTERRLIHAELKTSVDGLGIQGFEFKTGDAQSQQRSFAQVQSSACSIEPPSGFERGRTTIMRAVGPGGPGPWVPVFDAWELKESAKARTQDETSLQEFFGQRGDASTNEELVRFLAGMFERRAKAVAREHLPNQEEGSPSTSSADGPSWVLVPEESFTSCPEDSPSAFPMSRTEMVSPQRLLLRLLFGEVQEHEQERESELEEDPNDGASPPLRPHSQDQRKAPRAPTEPFADAAMRAIDAYLANLRQADKVTRSAARLVEDGLVVTACLQRAYRARELSIHQFLKAQVRAIRALIGASHAPLPRALTAIPVEDRHVAWVENALLPALALPLYNLCLAEHLVTGGDAVPEPDFASTGPALWFRHVLRSAPSSVGELVGELERQVPLLRSYGALWLADEWPAFVEAVPFDTFVSQLVADVAAMDQLVLALKSAAGERCRFREPDDGSTGVGFVGGELCSGFREDDIVQTFTGAFQVAAPKVHSRYAPLERVPVKRFMDVAELENWAIQLPENRTYQRALALLRRFAT